MHLVTCVRTMLLLLLRQPHRDHQRIQAAILNRAHLNHNHDEEYLLPADARSFRWPTLVFGGDKKAHEEIRYSDSAIISGFRLMLGVQAPSLPSRMRVIMLTICAWEQERSASEMADSCIRRRQESAGRN